MKNICLAAYDEKGEIQAIVSGPEQSVYTSLALNTNLPFLELEQSPFSAIHYVVDGQIAERPEMPIAVNGLTISGVVEGAAVTVEDAPAHQADGTDIELSFDTVGLFKVTIDMWPYQMRELYIENPPHD